jgi:predicted enzyme related to lactoylglutathione lyase/uncharacterized protein YndB with AHSA1/START domain
MSANVTAVATLRVTRLIKAPREQVFAAWTNPEKIKRWFAPDTCQVLSAKVDLKVGGEYLFHVKTAGGSDGGESSRAAVEMDLRGVYREIKRPARLVYTWNWQGNPQMESGETLVTVDFLDKEGFTEVQITHDLLPTPELRENHSYGWNGCLDKLEKQLDQSNSNGESCSRPGAFCWNELMAAETAGASRFYTQLFGWETEQFGGPMKYTMFKKNGQKAGGLMQKPHEQAPPHWLAYVEVENVDVSVKKAGELGAKIMMPPMDIPTVGRIAIFQDPQGAALGIFQPERK